jgi:heme/copper-type cytochrome/quinol oxidase subunit 3
MVEYYEAAFDISDSVYSSTFFMLTGLHGLHVIVGVSFILFCFLRLLKNHFTMSHYLGFVMAI